MQRKTGCTGCEGAALPQPAAASAPGANAQSVVLAPPLLGSVFSQVKWLGQSLSCLHAMSFSSQRFSPLGLQPQSGGVITVLPASTAAPASASGNLLGKFA
jgi:hypothetical protein